MKQLLAALLWAGSLPLWAQSPLFEGPMPTRLQFCQQELQGAEGEERKRLLRECLVRRAEAERLVARDCRRQAREVPGAPADKARWQRDCEYRALAVHSSELPQRPEPVANPVQEATADAGAEAPAAAAVSVESDRKVTPVVLPDTP